MRPELELMEKIEKYLKSELTGSDKAAFEKQMAGDPALREEVRLQEEVMKGIERAMLKEKITRVGKAFHFQKNFIKWGLGGLGLIIILAAAFFYYKSQNLPEYEGSRLSEYNEQGEKLWADADRNITAQRFMIDASKDTVIETKGGIVMAIPAFAFIDENNQPVNGKINLTVKEALDPATMMIGGLSTKSGDQLLETGGMFYTDARKDDKIVKIDPAKGIYAEVPTDSIKPGMQLFNGVRKPDGTIDWVNPVPLEKDLVLVDIQSLNFYPPLYLDSLQRWGYDIGNKKFTDSLYYSLARFFKKQARADTVKALISEREYIEMNMTAEKVGDRKENISIYEGPDSLFRIPNVQFESDSIVQPQKDFFSIHFSCGINPARIKAIWNSNFENTILATREFEERLRLIHLIGDAALLDVYVNNLDKSLSYSDSLIASRMSPGSPFHQFALRRDGKVKGDTRQFQLLKNYYENKSEAFTEAITKTQKEFWDKQTALDSKVTDERSKYVMDSINRTSQNFIEEFRVNLREAYRQLGYDTTPRPPAQDVYRVPVTTTGWLNVDKYVLESTLTRSTLNYTDPESAKKAVINYLPFSVQINQWNEYDRVYVYLLPDKLTSYMRLNGAEGKYSEKLNELMQYDMLCIAYKGEQAYYYSENSIQAKDYTGITLVAIGKEELDQKLYRTGSNAQSQGLAKEQVYLQFDIKDRQRQKQNADLLDLTLKVIKVIFPCMNDESLARIVSK